MKKYTFTILFSLLALFYIILFFSSYDNNGFLLFIPNAINDLLYGFDTAQANFWDSSVSVKKITVAIIFFSFYFLIGLGIDALIEWIKSQHK